ncbi:nitroreductase [Candidatus Kirkpatrickella diaphorinae]|uniref:Putative NAD(P)H nitroreductase n=1 Tax=Candidatus Kirkpatrickella diaphorinae TaxID=2984322 RepID=A0ABY6GMF3_9PROT|nr:nitroreductase [Candidatus Kirkpatrickella diaphorinae]UYH51946.1 nitroreductase [Candidatus Kirkpatrickella diaphorinae]
MPGKNKAMEVLLSRTSTDRLDAPAPKGSVLMQILSTSLRAPDHGRMRPWRFITVAGKHRAAFAELLVAAMRRTDPEVKSAKLEKKRARYAEVPMTIILGMDLHPNAKIPVDEQVMAVAAGAMNVLNALHAEGFGGMWVSGAFQNDEIFREKLGLTRHQKIAGFLQVGTVEGRASETKRPDIDLYHARWKGDPVAFGADK